MDNQVGTEIAILQKVINDNHRLTEENKRLEDKITDLNGELGKKNAHNFSLQSQLNAIIKVYHLKEQKALIVPYTDTFNQEIVHITNNMFPSQYGGVNG